MSWSSVREGGGVWNPVFHEGGGANIQGGLVIRGG